MLTGRAMDALTRSGSTPRMACLHREKVPPRGTSIPMKSRGAGAKHKWPPKEPVAPKCLRPPRKPPSMLPTVPGSSLPQGLPVARRASTLPPLGRHGLSWRALCSHLTSPWGPVCQWSARSGGCAGCGASHPARHTVPTQLAWAGSLFAHSGSGSFPRRTSPSGS